MSGPSRALLPALPRLALSLALAACQGAPAGDAPYDAPAALTLTGETLAVAVLERLVWRAEG